jgi:predicted amidohydrolase
VYRKLHLWDREKLIFAPGSASPPVLDTRIGRLAVIICYDLEFPELTRSVALAGTQLMLVPTNWPVVPRPEGERPPEAMIAMATARVNRMAVACADRVGRERGQEWTGGTTIVGVDGWVAAESRMPGLVAAGRRSRARAGQAPDRSRRRVWRPPARALHRHHSHTHRDQRLEPRGDGSASRQPVRPAPSWRC